jgi:hypothetical protein
MVTSVIVHCLTENKRGLVTGVGAASPGREGRMTRRGRLGGDAHFRLRQVIL